MEGMTNKQNNAIRNYSEVNFSELRFTPWETHIRLLSESQMQTWKFNRFVLRELPSLI